MKSIFLSLTLGAIWMTVPSASATDTTPPTLDITHTWIEKAGTVSRFKMLLDPRDDVGFSQSTVFFRSSLNNGPLPAGWNWMPWTRGQPFTLSFTCTACTIEIQVRDAAGNASPTQRRTFKAPFPYSSGPPNLTLRLTDGVVFDGPITDCRGLYAGNLNGDGKDDLLQLDRTTGDVVVMQTQVVGYGRYVALNLGANTIEDSVGGDLDGDGDLDFAAVTGGALNMYVNTGPDGNGLVQFNPVGISLLPTLITTVQHVTAGDITGEGKPELIITGTADDGMGGTVNRVGWLLNDATWTFNAGNCALAPATTGTGRLAVADMDRDGRLDLVVTDSGNNQLVIFKNNGAGALAGTDESNVDLQPQLISTGLFYGGPPPTLVPLLPTPAQSLAVADVTGDGRPDIVVALHALLFSNPNDPNDGRNKQFWRLYENSATGFRAHPEVFVGESPAPTTTAQDFPSDVLLRDLNQDNYPEIIVTNFFGNGLQLNRFKPQLGTTNEVTSFALDTVNYVPVPDFPDPPYMQPSRLAAGSPFAASSLSLGSIAVTFAGSDRTMWNENISRASLTAADVYGATQTDSDPNGLEGDNGINTYTAFVGEYITSELICINNTANALNGRFLDVTMPANCSLDAASTDPGWSFVTVGVKTLRWTVDIPANGVVIRRFRMRILSGAVNSPIKSTCYVRNGAALISSSAMPVVTIREPVQVRYTVETQSDNSGGDTAYCQEWIAYRVTLTNQSDHTLVNNKLIIPLPLNTTHLDHCPDSVLGVTPALMSGLVAYAPWKPNATVALNQLVLDHNNHLQKCIANGISSMSPPTWNVTLNGVTNDGAVQWKNLGLKSVTSLVWTGFDLPPDDPNTTADDIVVELRVKIKAGLVNNTKINRALITFTRSDGAKQTSPAFPTTILNPLEINLSMDKTIARPGEIVRYTFTVHNRNFFDLKNAKVVNAVPDGMVLVESGASDGADSGITGGTGNFNQFPGYVPANLSPTSSPISHEAGDVLTWKLGTIPARATRIIVVDMQVQEDVPTDYYKTGQQYTMEVQNSNYNFVGNNLAGTRLFAINPVGGAAALPQNALSTKLLGLGPPRRTLMSGDSPLAAPNLALTKSALGPRNEAVVPDKYERLPIEQVTGGEVNSKLLNGEWIFNLMNDPKINNDVRMTYSLHVTNSVRLPSPEDPDPRPTGPGRNVRVRDVIPPGLTFVGFVAKDSVFVNSYQGFHFYDALGKEIDATIPANITKVRSFDFAGGDLAVGGSFYFTYEVVGSEAVVPGTVYTSQTGGSLGVKDGMSYTLYPGYYLRADNLWFPVDGGPEAVKVKVTGPAEAFFHYPGGVPSAPEVAISGAGTFGASESGSSASSARSGARGAAGPAGTDQIAIAMPYDVRSGPGAPPLPPLTNMTMTFMLPKGYKIANAYAYEANGNFFRSYDPSSPSTDTNFISAVRQADQRFKVTFPLGSTAMCWPVAEITYDPLHQAALVDASGTKVPAIVDVTLTGKYAQGEAPLSATADESSNWITTPTAHGCIVGAPVQFPTLVGGAPLVAGQTYYVAAVVDSKRIAVKDSPNGAVVNITTNATAGTTFRRFVPGKVLPMATAQMRIDSRASSSDVKLFVGRCAPMSVKRGDTFTYTIFTGNLIDSHVGTGTITMKVPAGCQGLSATRYRFNGIGGGDIEGAGVFGSITNSQNIAGNYDAAFPNGPWTRVTWKAPLAAGATVVWSNPGQGVGEGGVVQLTVKVLESFTGNVINDESCVFDVTNALPKSPGISTVVVTGGNAAASQGEVAQKWLQGSRYKYNEVTGAEFNRDFTFDENVSCGICFGGTDVLQMLNGVSLIPLPRDRVMLIGPPAKVFDGQGGTAVNRVLVNDPSLRIVVGPGTTGDVSLLDVPGYTPGVVPANQVLTDLGVPNLNIIAAKKASLLIGNGGNLVKSGGPTHLAAGVNGSHKPVVLDRDGLPRPVAEFIGQDGASVVSNDGAGIVAGGGGNLVSTTRGTIVAGGGGNALPPPPATLIGHDGATLIGHDGATVVSNDGAGLIGLDGASLVGTNKARIVAGGGGNAVNVSNGNQ